MAKVYGVVRVMNTLQQGNSVAGLEAGSAVLSKEASDVAAEFYPNAIIAVTNHHVVGEQKTVMVNFHFSQVPVPAAVLKVCPQRDLAFLHIDTQSEYFQMANFDPQTQAQRKIELISSCPLIDQPLDEFAAVTSVGYPSGTPHQTVTHGSLTAKDVLCNKLMHYHDCVINPGNSGGALLHEGMLVGINTAISTQPQSVSIATPVELVTSLLGFLKPQQDHPDMSHEAFRQLMAHYHVSSPPQELLARFEEDECGGLNEDGVPIKFSQWFSEHGFDKPESHHLVQQVLTYLEVGMPEKIHALREGGWVKCSSHSSACKGIETQLIPDRIVFQEHFQVSATVPVLDQLTQKYGSEGVVITGAQEHEGLQDGDVLLKINDRQLDNFGNFVDNGAPFFTAFKFQPGEAVELQIGCEEGIKKVEYTYDLVDTIPRIHAPQLTPFEAAAVVKIGGLTITQMNAAMAARYPKYLKAPFNDAVVGVVVAVDAMSAEWHIQKISPGALLTHVNGRELEGSIVESLQGGAKFLTFEIGDKNFIKLV